MNLVIIGSGGHAGVVIKAVQTDGRFNIIGLLDDLVTPPIRRHGFPVLGPTSMLPQHAQEYFIAVGDNRDREHLVNGVHKYPNIIHPGCIYEGALDCRGSFFAVGSYVGNGSRVGDFCILNTKASLDHNSSLGNFSHLAPGVVTGGRVTIGHHVFVGIGAMIRDGVTIGNNCTIGMGSVVLEDIPDNSIGWGNPWRNKHENA